MTYRLICTLWLAAALLPWAGLGGAEALKLDPFEAGPLGARVQSYDFTPQPERYGMLLGQGSAGPLPLKTTFRGEVAFPARLEGGPLPLVLVLHGLAPTCVDSERRPIFDDWPCSKPGQRELPSHQGYRQLARHLASHGYVVASIDASALTDLPPGPNQLTDLGDGLRSELIGWHLAFWRHVQNGAIDVFRETLAGRLDFSRVGLVGHSRGGSGVVRYAVDRRAEAAGAVLRAIALIAPANTYAESGGRIARIPVPFFVAAPYCDASVDDLNGLLFYDDARYEAYAKDNWNSFGIFLGANHSYFNSVWSPGGGQMVRADDWTEHSPPSRRNDAYCGTGSRHRLADAEQSRLGAAYVAMFLRWHIGGERVWAAAMQGTADIPNPTPGKGQVLLTTHPPEPHRLVINPMADYEHLATNALGGAVRISNAVGTEICPRLLNGRFVGCVAGRAPDQFIDTFNEPHAPELTAMAVAWDSGRPISIVNELPPALGDLTSYDHLQVRIGLDYAKGVNTQGLSGFRFVLRDTAGNTAVIPLPTRTPAARKMPGEPGLTTRLLLHAFRVPLSKARGIDLAAVRSIELRSGRSGPGRVVLADLMVWRAQSVPVSARSEPQPTLARRARGAPTRPAQPKHS